MHKDSQSQSKSLKRFHPKDEADEDLGLLKLFDAYENENVTERNSQSTLPEEEKMKRYRQIYRVLEQFIYDENPQKRLDKLSLLNEEQSNQNQGIY